MPSSPSSPLEIASTLPLTETVTPTAQVGVADAVRGAHDAGTAVYSIGGGTSLGFGLSASKPGIGLSLGGLTQVIDYPARDMTITVEAGVTMQKLAETLATERQWLPVDVPQPEQATIGGVVASAAYGPRRYGWGTMRDYVIGISAVDGRGMPFKGGGRVVKNVAGYDFCKLLTGSYGTLGVITQVTLKIKPIPERSALVACDVADLAMAEKLLAGLITSSVTPVAIEFISGPAWSDVSQQRRLIVGVEGTSSEVDWMTRTVADEWKSRGIATTHTFEGDQARELWRSLGDFSTSRSSPLVLKAKILPSQMCAFIAIVQQIDAKASIQAHAGTGIVIVRFAEFDSGAVSKSLLGVLQPAALAARGDVVVLSSNGLGELPRQVQWGGIRDSNRWMTNIKRQFDPKDILNPGRFIYEAL